MKTYGQLEKNKQQQKNWAFCRAKMETLNNEARKYVNWLAQLFLIRKIKKVCRLMTIGRVLFMNKIETVHISGSDVLHTVRSVNYSV